MSVTIRIVLMAGSFGVFIAKNSMMKAEYADYRYPEEFHGAMLETTVVF